MKKTSFAITIFVFVSGIIISLAIANNVAKPIRKLTRAAAGIAKILFFVFVILFVLTLISGIGRRRTV